MNSLSLKGRGKGPAAEGGGKGEGMKRPPGRIEPVTQPRRVHMAIALASIDPVMAWLKAHGQGWSDIAGTPGAINATRTDGVRQIFLQDPDGYWIEVNDALKKR